MQSLADALLIIHNQEADSQVFVHSAFPMVFSTTEINCCTRKGFSTHGAPVSRKRGDGFFIGDVAGDKHDPRRQFGPVLRDPGVDIGAVHASGRAHVGDHAQKFSRLQQPQSFGAGFGANHGVAAAFQRGSDVGHHGRLILDEQHRQTEGLVTGCVVIVE